MPIDPSVLFNHPTSQPTPPAVTSAEPQATTTLSAIARASQSDTGGPVRPGQAPGPATFAGQRVPNYERPEQKEPEDVASTIFDGGRPGDTPAEYDSQALAAAWKQYELAAADSGDEAQAGDLAEGKQAVAAYMHENGVPIPVAKELTAEASQYAGREPLDDAAVDAANTRCLTELRREFGADTDRQIRFAQAAYQHALQQPGIAWWLAEMDAAGMGSNPKVVKAFARIGAKLARGSRR